MDVAVEAGEDAESEADLRADGGEQETGTALSWASEAGEQTARSALDALPGRLVFVGGAAAGSVVTLLVVAVYAVYV